MAKGEMPDWLYMVVHSADTLRVIALRKETEVLDDFASTNYLGIPLVDAVRAVVRNRSSEIKESTGGGVRLEDWSQRDQERLKKGLKPLGHPEHPNV